MTPSFDLERDLVELPNSVVIGCPNCGKPAVFEPAKLEVNSSKTSASNRRKRDQIRIRPDRPKRNYMDWHREHVLSYFGLGGADRRFNTKSYPAGPKSRQLNTLWGTSICGNCHRPKKVKLAWPQDAHFQVSYAGRLLWFFNREQVVAMIELLNGANTSKHPWGFWFDRKLPTVFKTARARRQLPAKLKRMLRA